LKTAGCVAVGFSAFLAVAGTSYAAGLRWNGTPSMPLGIWETGTKGKVARGDVVVACLPPGGVQQRYLAAGYCPSGFEPVLKPVAAVAGDSVRVGPAGVSVNGIPVPQTASLVRDGRGRPIPPYPTGTYPVHAGEVWLLAPRPDSFDSRYLGPVPAADIQSRATPLWVWR
jgi:conjugative transfer signal peptidase TraF